MNSQRLAELVDAHAAALELYAARWAAAPEDCVQEAFVELARQPEEPERVRAWLFRVVKNRALNALRGRRRRREREEAAARLRPETVRCRDTSMKTRFAFVGFRHAHIMDMYHRCRRHPEIEIVACCEEDVVTRAALSRSDDVKLTHDDFGELLHTIRCDVVAVGDCYGRRGSLIIRSLNTID